MVLVSRPVRVVSCRRKFVPSDVVVVYFDLLEGEGRLRLPELLSVHASPEGGVHYLRRMKEALLGVLLPVLILVGLVVDVRRCHHQGLVVANDRRVS